MCFLVFASCGQFALENADGTNNQSIGYVMIIFSCLFIAAFASTWGTWFHAPILMAETSRFCNDDTVLGYSLFSHNPHTTTTNANILQVRWHGQ